MKKSLKKILAVILTVIMVFWCAGAVSAYAVEEIVEQGEELPVITVTSGQRDVAVRDQKQLYCNTDGVTWSSSDMSVGTVDQNGLFTAKSVGRTTVTASKKIGDTVVKGSFEVCVTQRHNWVNDYLDKHNLLSYKYSFIDDYFYTDKNGAWQKVFGYNKIYDLAAPFVFMEYDYVRVHFEYEGRDWLLQLWKGQYGFVFYGCETGLYSKEHSDESDTIVTTYMGADENDWIKMQTDLYHDKTGNGNYEIEFSTEDEYNWWQTGFKPGHLRQQEPATELKMIGKLTFKDEEMTKAFVKGFEECGFKQVEKCEQPGTDTFYVDGNEVFYNWQDNSEAENTMPIKNAGATLIFLNISAIFGALLLGLLSMFGLGLLAIIL